MTCPNALHPCVLCKRSIFKTVESLLLLVCATNKMIVRVELFLLVHFSPVLIEILSCGWILDRIDGKHITFARCTKEWTTIFQKKWELNGRNSSRLDPTKCAARTVLPAKTFEWCPEDTRHRMKQNDNRCKIWWHAYCMRVQTKCAGLQVLHNRQHYAFEDITYLSPARLMHRHIDIWFNAHEKGTRTTNVRQMQ